LEFSKIKYGSDHN